MTKTANKKRFSQIGPAVPEEIGHKQAHKHAKIVLLYIKEKSFCYRSVTLISEVEGKCSFQNLIAAKLLEAKGKAIKYTKNSAKIIVSRQ